MMTVPAISYLLDVACALDQLGHGVGWEPAAKDREARVGSRGGQGRDVDAGRADFFAGALENPLELLDGGEREL